MVLPFSDERKAVWNLKRNLKAVEWAIEEKNPQHFVEELKALYPKIRCFGLEMPLVEPTRIGHPEYDRTWHGYHLTFLKVLRRWIRNDSFDVKQWNTDVKRENEKRERFVSKHIHAKEQS